MSFLNSLFNRRVALKAAVATPLVTAAVGAVEMGIALADGTQPPSGGDTVIVDRDLTAEQSVPTTGVTKENPELEGTEAKRVNGYSTMAAASWPKDFPAPDVVEFQGQKLDDTWGDWVRAEFLTDLGEPSTDAAWIGPSKAVHVRAFRNGVDVSESLTAHMIATSVAPEDIKIVSTGGGQGFSRVLGTTYLPGTFGPSIISRAEWGADESLVKSANNGYADELKAVIIHHTAGSNNYSREEAPQQLRGVLAFHTQSRGWADIGYNVLADKYGRLYEGRRGGLERNVNGAHAMGFNFGSFGISCMGDYMTNPIPDSTLQQITQMAAWKLDGTFHSTLFEPSNWNITVQMKKTGNVTMPNRLFAHRDVDYTDCPGDALYSQMDRIRSLTESKMKELRKNNGEHYRAFVEAGGEAALGTVTHIQVNSGIYLVTRLTKGLIVQWTSKINAVKSRFAMEWAPSWGLPLESTSGPQQRFENGLAVETGGQKKFIAGAIESSYNDQVRGAIGAYYLNNGAEFAFGKPLGTEFPVKGGAQQNFARAVIAWAPETGAFATVGAIGAKWTAMGGAESWLGLPIGPERALQGGQGAVQAFQRGQIHWSVNSPAAATRGEIDQYWASLGWESGRLGYPISDQFSPLAGGGASQVFQNGTVFYNPRIKKSFTVNGGIRAAYASKNYEAGALGYPTSEERNLGNGASQSFENGFQIHWSPATGSHVTGGGFQSYWAANGWQKGPLGYPATDEYRNAQGQTEQRFQGGLLIWDSANSRVVFKRK